MSTIQVFDVSTAAEVTDWGKPVIDGGFPGKQITAPVTAEKIAAALGTGWIASGDTVAGTADKLAMQRANGERLEFPVVNAPQEPDSGSSEWTPPAVDEKGRDLTSLHPTERLAAIQRDFIAHRGRQSANRKDKRNEVLLRLGVTEAELPYFD